MRPSQSNTQPGAVVFPAGEDLSAAEGRLTKLTHDSGAPEIVLPTSNTDNAAYLLVDPNPDGQPVTVEPFEPSKNRRVRLKGTCNPGAELILADVGTAADKGKVRDYSAVATPGDYRIVAIAEEAGVDGQLVLCRPYNGGIVTREE